MPWINLETLVGYKLNLYLTGFPRQILSIYLLSNLAGALTRIKTRKKWSNCMFTFQTQLACKYKLLYLLGFAKE